MPHGLTMLARGLANMEGVLAEISPQINMVEIAAARMKESFLTKDQWKKEIKNDAKRLYRSLHKAMDIPSLAADILQGHMKDRPESIWIFILRMSFPGCSGGWCGIL